MEMLFYLKLIAFFVYHVGGVEEDSVDLSEKRLSWRIREVIAYYQENGAVLVPASDIPDPLQVPDMVRQIGATPVSFKDTLVYGLKNLTLDHVNTDIDIMQVFVAVCVKRLVITGNHSTKYWFTKVGGEFNLTLLDVEATGAVALKTNEEGEMFAEDSNLDMSFRESVVDFKSLGALGSVLRGVLGSSGSILFEGVKPVVLQEVRTKVITRFNEKIKAFGGKFNLNDSKPLVQMALEEGRLYVKNKGYDPYHIRDYSFENNLISLNITDLVLEGLSDFHKVGKVKLFMENGTIHLGLHLAAFGLKGGCKWTVDFGKDFVRKGFTDFKVPHFQIKVSVLQSIDVRKQPTLQDLDLNVGPVILQMEGTGSLDTLISLVVTRLPHFIRLIVVDAIEEPVRMKVQKMFDKLDVQNFAETNLQYLDNF